MTDSQGESAALLEAARRALSPAAADRARVRRSLEAALAKGRDGQPEAPPASSRQVWRNGTLARRGGLVVAIGVVAAVAGYGAGFRAGRRASSPPPPVAASPAGTPLTKHRGDLSGPPPAGPAGEDTLRRPALVRSTGADAGRATGADAVRRVEQERRAKTSSADRGDTLGRELRAVRSAERALRGGNPGMALALLRELDRTIPEGRLVEERQALAAIARCQQGDVPFGVDPAEDFAAHHPGSVYRARVEQSCARTDRGATGDSPERR